MFTLKKHKPTISSSSITRITDLDDYILAEIITKLPIKHMIGCQSVSRLWCNVISSICIPKITSSPVYGLLFNTRRIFSDPQIEKGPWSFACINSLGEKVGLPNASLVESCLGRRLPFDHSPNSLLDCCNGMLLFFDRSSMQFYVCNPSTEQYIAIPNSPQSHVPQDGALFFDPHFKIVHISGSYPRLNIYSQATHKWSVYNLDLDPCVTDSFWSPRYVFLDGLLYNLSMSGHLVIIDLQQIDSRAIKLPDIVVAGNLIGCLGVSQGILHYSWSDKHSNMSVWMLVQRGDTKEWVVKHTISLDYYYEHPSLAFHSPWFSVFAFHPTSDILFAGSLGELFCYDPSTKRLEIICRVREDIVICSGQSFVFPFSVNLTPLCAPLKEIAGKEEIHKKLRFD
ncbi:hypothetical protein IFM89_031633 [Coptis chinensis]|uniref:F-box domain-containing protein n=1 Tax=Coptis chinensis TaxID=261450 RepID=A0A835H6L6_9MAGN|nr:hypothetical protein IFM89_031633 [Coptis chinensis]